MNLGANNTYLGNIKESISSLLLGMKLSIRHFFEARKSRKPFGIHENNYFQQKTGIFTLQYPKESIPVPDIGRYRLHNEIDDCIVCDKCAKICPVDCIEIEPIKSVEEFGKTSDGTPKRLYAAKFDIDMGKCCFCGLCTTVCPTECLTMTKSYDFSEYDIADHIYEFSEMTPIQILEKKQEIEKVNREKELAKAAKTTGSAENVLESQAETSAEKTPVPKPAAFKPRMPMKPKTSSGTSENKPAENAQNQALELMKAKAKNTEEDKIENTTQTTVEKTSKPVFKPRIPVKPKTSGNEIKEDSETKEEGKTIENQPTVAKDSDVEQKQKPAKPVFKPKIVIKPKAESEEDKEINKKKPSGASPENSNEINKANSENTPDHEANKPKPRPVFRPKIPSKKKNAEGTNDESESPT